MIDRQGWILALDIAGEAFERFAARLDPESALRDRTLTLVARLLEKIEALEASTTDDPGGVNTKTASNQNDEWG